MDLIFIFVFDVSFFLSFFLHKVNFRRDKIFIRLIFVYMFILYIEDSERWVIKL